MTHPNKREVHAKSMEFNEKRYADNMEILRKLKEYLKANPSMRFSQALSNLSIVNTNDYNQWNDDYYTEPSEILKRMK